MQRYGIRMRMERGMHPPVVFTVAQHWQATPFQLRRMWGGINGVLFHQMLHGVDIQPPSSRFSKSIGHQHVLEPELRTSDGALDVDTWSRPSDCRRQAPPFAEARAEFCPHSDLGRTAI